MVMVMVIENIVIDVGVPDRTLICVDVIGLCRCVCLRCSEVPEWQGGGKGKAMSWKRVAYVVGLESENGDAGIDRQGEVMREDDATQCGIRGWDGR
jgi:hypothetical protein